MYAAYYDKTGTACDVLQIGEMPRPEPGEGEVLVRVYASGVNPSDVKKRAGCMLAPGKFTRAIPHSDGAGIIEAVGGKVNAKRIGERVWLWNAQWNRPYGTAAEWAAVPELQAVELPEHLSFQEGACLGIPAQTAWAATCCSDTQSPGTVLIHGGAGAVGELAIMMAKQSGARVIATASTDEKASIAELAGAEVIRYLQVDTTSNVMELTGGHGVDHIVDVDFGANWQTDAEVLAPNGTIAAYSAPSAPVLELEYYAFAAKSARLRFIQVYLLPEHERLQAIAGITAMLNSRQLSLRIAKQFALKDIVQAHELQESGWAIGNIIIDL